jgi:hypothetical protein
MPKVHLPTCEEDLRLSDPVTWPFQALTRPADLYMAKGAVFVYLNARRQLEKDIEENTLETAIRTGILTERGWPLCHTREICTLRHAVNPQTPQEDTQEWMAHVHEALLRNISPRRSTTLYLTLFLHPSGIYTKSLRHTAPWW